MRVTMAVTMSMGTTAALTAASEFQAALAWWRTATGLAARYAPARIDHASVVRLGELWTVAVQALATAADLADVAPLSAAESPVCP